MADVLTILQQFLCYGNNACIQEFQQYAYKPMEGIFYAVFFPILFILLFVYIVSSALGTFRNNNKFRILIAVAVFAFIILQGWYYFFLVLGKLWLYVIIFLGFFWVLMHTFVGSKSDGGGAQGRTTSGAGALSALTKAAKDEVLGVTKVQLQTLEADIATLRNTPVGSHGIDDISARINGTLLEMQGNPQKYGLHLSKIQEMKKEYIRIAKQKRVKVDD